MRHAMAAGGFAFFSLGAVLSALAIAQTNSPVPADDGAEGQEIIVNGVRDIVVNGRARRCRPLPGDPLNKINVSSPFDKPQLGAVVPAGGGRFAFEPNAEQVTGPDFWQRTGVGIDQYVFRAPADGKPLCIGATAPDGNTFAGFRRILDAAAFHGKRVRFTAWAATGKARGLTFFLAAGVKQTKLDNGGNTNNRPLTGNHGWTPILLEIGPVPESADHISYGFHLHGSGDAWVYKPKLEIVTDEPLEWRKGDFVMIGGKR